MRTLNLMSQSNRALFDVGAKIAIVFCHLVLNMSAVLSTDKCNFSEAEKAVPDLNWIGGNISS